MARMEVQRERAERSRRKKIVAATLLSFCLGAGCRYKVEVARLKAISLQRQQQELLTPSKTKLGDFLCTAYCGCAKCCGHTHGITKTGTKATAKRTIAVDPSVIPLGTEVYVDGECYVAEDTGSAIKGKRIDIFFANHAEAVEFGKQTLPVEKEVMSVKR